MKGIILAAGRGSRMRSLTEDLPKCLVQVGGRSLLDWQMEALRGADISDIALVRGYRAEALDEFGARSFLNPRWAETNMVMSLGCAAEWLRKHVCIVSYSDILYPAATVKQLAASEAGIAITYDRLWREQWTMRFEDPLSDAETFRVDEDGCVVEIGNRPSSFEEVQGQYMGLLKFTPASWQTVETWLAALTPAARDRLDMTSLLRGLIASGTAVEGVAVDGRFFEVDSDGDLVVAEEHLVRRGGVL